MLIKRPHDIRPSEITSYDNYINRRSFMRAGVAAGTALLAPGALAAVIPEARRAPLSDVRASDFSTDEECRG